MIIVLPVCGEKKSLKNPAKVSGKDSLLIGVFLMYIVLGRSLLFTSLAVLTASQSDAEFSGTVRRLTDFDFLISFCVQ